jgi:uridine kinase
MTNPSAIKPAVPRSTVQVHFADGRTFEGPKGATLAEFVAAAYPQAEIPIVAALVNGDLEELSAPVLADAHVLPLDIRTSDGMRIYQRSLCFILVVAARELYPQARIIIDHSVTLGGFFCRVAGRALFSSEELAALEGRMREIVAADAPIVQERLPLAEAKALFAAQGDDDKVRLLAHHEEPEVTVYTLRGVRDYFYGYMAPSTGRLACFSLQRYPPGFILRLPRRQDPNTLPPYRDYPKLMAVFREYGRWLEILGIEDIGSLNAVVEGGHMREAILISEALHEKQIAEIAARIVQQEPRVRLVLIAGPSSSGKTTFARRLAIQLMVNGVRPVALGLDDYFVDRALTPRDENGQYDFEALEAIDLALFNRQLAALLAGETVQTPRYNFKTGRSEPGETLRLGPDAILIVEGIHGLNPRLVTSVPAEQVYRIYVSALTQLNIDHHNRVPTTDLRLLRRIVRDAQFRGYSAQETIARWESVRRGEERNIFPYQENADVMFNSALAYELAVLKPLVEPLLWRVPRGSMESIEARRLLAFLQWVRPCQADLVPDNSLLREFIGGSILQDFVLQNGIL